MNKKYKQGAEDTGKAAEEGFTKIGREIEIIVKNLMKNAKNQHEINDAIIEYIKEIMYEFSIHSNAYKKMSLHDKTLLISAMNEIKKTSVSHSELAQKYFENFYVMLGVDPLPILDSEKLSNLTGKDAEYALYVLIEYKEFFNGNEMACKEAEEFIDELPVPLSKRRIFEQAVKEIVCNVGLQNILNKYNFKRILEENEPLRERFDDQEQAETADNTDGSNTKFEPEESADFALPPDDTEEQFPELREIVLKHIPKISTDKNYTSKAKSENAFINKHSLPVAKEAAIALIDTSLLGSGSVGFLFTTYAIYYVEIWDNSEKVIKIIYNDIDYEKCGVAHDKKGKASSLNIAMKNANNIIIKDYINHEALLAMLTEVGKLSEFAPTDSPQSIAEMDYSVKLPFVKLLVNFMAHSKQPYIELMRFACDIGFDDEQLSELAQYISADPKEPDMKILMQINNNAPYGSRKSLKYALITEMFSQLQFVKGSSEESLLEHEFITNIAELYGFCEKEDIPNLRIAAQAKYKIITGQIKSAKELEIVAKALKNLAFSGGVSLVTIIGSSLLFFKTAWWFLIPGIGAIIGSALVGFNIALQIINRNKKVEAFNEQTKEMIENEVKSYRAAINKLLVLFPGMTKEILLLRKHLKRFLAKYITREEHYYEEEEEVEPGTLFKMVVEDVFSITGRGTVATGTVNFGKIKLNDTIEIISKNKTPKSTVVTGIEMFRKLLDSAEAGDEAGLLLRGISKNEIKPGDILIKKQ